MGLGFGLLSAQLRPGETDWTRAYDDTIRLAVEAERMGFTSVWTTEHHFVDDGYMPSLLVVGAALAQATSTIELGTGVILAPLHHPIRLAEDAATVQLLSHGRLTLGLGLGWAEIEFDGPGCRRAPARCRHGRDTCRSCPRRGPASRSATRAPCTTCPRSVSGRAHRTRIPVVIGGGAEPAIRRAARLADGIFSNATAEALRGAGGLGARRVRQRIGRDPATFRFIHYSMLIPGPSRAEALARYRDAIWAVQWKYSDMVASAGRPLPPPAAPAFIRPDEALLKRGATYAGTPDELVEALQAIRAAVPVPVELATRSHFPLLELDDQLELMRQLAEGVAPHV